MTKYSSFTMLALAAFLMCIFMISENISASDKPPLPNTSVTIPWKTFEELRHNKIDTVFVDSSDNSRVGILFNKATISVTVKDSVACCRVLIDYVVLHSGKWSSRVFMAKNNDISLSGTQCTDGDFIISTDSGFVLLSDCRNRSKQGHFSCEWYMICNSDNGLYSLTIPVPFVSQCKITATFPSDYSDISIDDFPVTADNKHSGQRIITCVIPSATKSAELHFARPFKVVDNESSDSSFSVISDIKTGEKISTVQQSILFIDNGTVLCLTALSINPLQIAPSSFTFTIPEHYSLLRIEGNGIRKWTAISKNTFIVNLGFKIENTYTAVFVMETETDSGGQVPCIDYKGANHQRGSFSFLLKGSDEIEITTMGNSIPFSGTEFRKSCSKALFQTINQLISEGVPSVNGVRSLDDGSPAFTFYKTPLNTRFRVLHHRTASIENAIADSAEITTCLTDDWKLITQVTWSVGQRDKKYISFSLPDSSDIWQISVNGKERSPLIDENGKIRISLYQNKYDGTEREQIKITIVYFQKYDSTDRIVLQAPIPDIPVTKMSWVVFYSTKHQVTDIKGDFLVTTGNLFKRRNQINKKDSDYLYQSMLQSGRARKIPMLLDASPKHIYGKKLLVVDEQPVLELTIKRSNNYYIVIIIFLCVLISVAILMLKKIFEKGKKLPFSKKF